MPPAPSTIPAVTNNALFNMDFLPLCVREHRGGRGPVERLKFISIDELDCGSVIPVDLDQRTSLSEQRLLFTRKRSKAPASQWTIIATSCRRLFRRRVG
jgi:hypothetical protein